MKAIKIHFIGEANRMDKVHGGLNIRYRVPIGNGYTGLFTSKRKATDFVWETNRFLNRCFLGLNRIYSDTLKEYRMIWPLLESDRKETKLNLFELEVKLRHIIRAIDDRFDQMLKYQCLDNGNPNFYLFKDLIRISRLLQESHQLILEIHLSRYNSMNALSIEGLMVEADMIGRNCQNYGHKQLEHYTFDENTGTILRAIS